MIKYFFIVVLFTPVYGFCQNLIPNSGFEEFEECPETATDFVQCSGWNVCGASPDLFNACSTGGVVDVPQSNFGFQYSHSGNGHAGLFLYDLEEYREFIGTELTSPVEIGDTIHFSFYISRGDANLATSYGCACNNFGFRFTNTQYSELNPVPIDNFSHWHYTEVVSDTADWLLINGQVEADDHYNYVVFGNFYENSSTEVQQIIPNCMSSYYYIDDVCFSKNPLCDISQVTNSSLFEEQFLFPNPFFDLLILSKNYASKQVDLKFYNTSGMNIICTISDNKIDTTHWPIGVYYAAITTNNAKHIYKLIKL